MIQENNRIDRATRARATVPFGRYVISRPMPKQNLAFWSETEQTYVCYFRVWDGLRRIARSTSKDFRTWTPAVLMQQIHADQPVRLRCVLKDADLFAIQFVNGGRD
jgi:hypothetical protein